MSEKVSGYSLLVTGLLVIVFAAFSVYQVFTSKAKPVQLFNFDSISINLGSLINAPDNATQEQMAMVESARSKVKPTEIIGKSMLNETSNIAAHLFLMGFIASIGQKIAGIGVMLLRPINVKVKETVTS